MMAQGSMDSDRLSSAGLSTHSSGTANVGGSVVGVRVGDPNLKREDEYQLGPLPPMWEKAFTPSGEVYFIDHNTGTSHWLDPRLARVRKHSLGECGEDELPYGWERVTDERYGSYYVDHINRRTQYENPVLQARRLRAEKIATENGGSSQQNGSTPTGELRGESFTLTLTKGTQGLGFTLIGAEGIPETEGYLQIRSIVPHSPAWMDGALRPGDVLVGVGQRGVRGLAHAQVAQVFQNIAPGAEVVLHLVRGYPLTFDSEDPNTRVLSTLAVEAAPAQGEHAGHAEHSGHAGHGERPPSQHSARAMQQLTRALRTRFNLDGAPRSPARDEPDSPAAPHSPTQRRLLSRSFDLDELGTNSEENSVPPRCPSADHLLTLATDSRASRSPWSAAGEELVLTLRRGSAGFGFTIADSVHGQKVKKVLERGRCGGLREGDVLLQIGDNDVRHAPHQHVVQVLKECPALHETRLVVWRRAAGRAPRSRSATRPQPATGAAPLSRSKTPTAEQLRAHDLRGRLGGEPVEATYAVPEQKQRSLLERRRRSSTPGGRLSVPAPGPALGPAPGPGPAHWQGQEVQEQWQEGGWGQETWVDNARGLRAWTEPAPAWGNEAQKWDQHNAPDTAWRDTRWEGAEAEGGWGAAATPTVRVDLAHYWPGDGSDNGGFPEDGMMPSPSTAAVSGRAPPRPREPDHSGLLRSHSPSPGSAGERTRSPDSRGKNDPMRLRDGSPRTQSPASRRSPSCYETESLTQQTNGYPQGYPQVVCGGGGGADPLADVVVRLARGAAGFGFRIVGGTEDGSRVAVGYVVPGGPAAGLLRGGDLLTSVDGVALADATHARAVALVCQAAARGHVTLGVRHNRADIQPLPPPHLPQMMPAEPAMHAPPGAYNILHPAPMYPPAPPMSGYEAGWPTGPYDVTVPRDDGEGFGFVVISSTNKATSTIGQLIPNSPAARCGLLRVGDTILAINHVPVLRLPHPEVVTLIKQSGRQVTLTVDPRPRY